LGLNLTNLKNVSGGTCRGSLTRWGGCCDIRKKVVSQRETGVTRPRGPKKDGNRRKKKRGGKKEEKESICEKQP